MEKLVSFSTRLTPEIKKKIKELSKDSGIKTWKIAEVAFNQYFKNLEKTKGDK